MALKLPKRHQGILFPPVIEDMVAHDAPVRAYDAMIDIIDMSELGIAVDHNKAGCPEYDPRSMLKLLVYGYSYNIRSSRKLERATHDNISFIWLMGGLNPSYKTISEFRRLNRKALKKVIRQCAHMCVDLDLIAGNVLFVDGTKIRANASISNSYTKEKAQKVLANIEKRIDKLIASCEQADADEEGQPSFAKLSKGLENAKKLRSRIESIAEKLKSKDAPSSINTVDPDCCRVHSRQDSRQEKMIRMKARSKNSINLVSFMTKTTMFISALKIKHYLTVGSTMQKNAAFMLRVPSVASAAILECVQQVKAQVVA
jgi:transposase